MSDNQDLAHPRKWAFDKTLNIPTMLAIASMTTSAALFVAKGWNEQDRRIDAVERIAASAQNEVKRLESAQSAHAKTQADQLHGLRNEFRGDLRDISSKLDALLMNSAGVRPETKQWTRP